MLILSSNDLEDTLIGNIKSFIKTAVRGAGVAPIIILFVKGGWIMKAIGF